MSLSFNPLFGTRNQKSIIKAFDACKTFLEETDLNPLPSSDSAPTVRKNTLVLSFANDTPQTQSTLQKLAAHVETIGPFSTIRTSVSPSHFSFYIPNTAGSLDTLKNAYLGLAKDNAQQYLCGNFKSAQDYITYLMGNTRGNIVFTEILDKIHEHYLDGVPTKGNLTVDSEKIENKLGRLKTESITADLTQSITYIWEGLNKLYFRDIVLTHKTSAMTSDTGKVTLRVSANVGSTCNATYINNRFKDFQDSTEIPVTCEHQNRSPFGRARPEIALTVDVSPTQEAFTAMEKALWTTLGKRYLGGDNTLGDLTTTIEMAEKNLGYRIQGKTSTGNQHRLFREALSSALAQARPTPSSATP